MRVSMKKSSFYLIGVFFFIMISNLSNVAISAIVLSTHPVNEAELTPVYQPISVKFDQAINPLTVSFSLLAQGNPNQVPGNLEDAPCNILNYNYNRSPFYELLIATGLYLHHRLI